jgi:hypothetical protein
MGFPGRRRQSAVQYKSLFFVFGSRFAVVAVSCAALLVVTGPIIRRGLSRHRRLPADSNLIDPVTTTLQIVRSGTACMQKDVREQPRISAHWSK